MTNKKAPVSAKKAVTRKSIAKKIPAVTTASIASSGYAGIHVGIVELLQAARQAAARSVNALMTATYWEIGRRIVEAEQKGKRRAGYGEQLIERLAADLTHQFRRGFSRQNLQQMRAFYQLWPRIEIRQTLSGESEILQTVSENSNLQIPQTTSAISTVSKFPALADIANRFPLPWSAYVRLLSVKSDFARQFYETEALCGGWSVRQLDRQINSQFYERTALSRNKAAMLNKGTIAKLEDTVTPEEAIKDPFVLEFLDLKDEYSENELEAALIARLEAFLLELGGDFAFIGRQKRLRLDDQWFRVDLLLFNRRLRCLVVIDLKIGTLTHADAGQMHMYLNYAREHWAMPGENPPVGLILCTGKGAALARYALEGLPNKVLAAEYKTVLPDEKLLADELENSRRILESQVSAKGGKRVQRG